MVPRIGNCWQAVSVHLSIPTREIGWTTDIDFQTPGGVRRVRFISSERYAPIRDFLHGFDSVRITDQNASGANHLEYGRYFVEVFVDDDNVRFVADEIADITNR